MSLNVVQRPEKKSRISEIFDNFGLILGKSDKVAHFLKFTHKTYQTGTIRLRKVLFLKYL